MHPKREKILLLILNTQIIRKKKKNIPISVIPTSIEEQSLVSSISSNQSGSQSMKYNKFTDNNPDSKRRQKKFIEYNESFIFKFLRIESQLNIASTLGWSLKIAENRIKSNCSRPIIIKKQRLSSSSTSSTQSSKKNQHLLSNNQISPLNNTNRFLIDDIITLSTNATKYLLLCSNKLDNENYYENISRSSNEPLPKFEIYDPGKRKSPKLFTQIVVNIDCNNLMEKIMNNGIYESDLKYDLLNNGNASIRFNVLDITPPTTFEIKLKEFILNPRDYHLWGHNVKHKNWLDILRG